MRSGTIFFIFAMLLCVTIYDVVIAVRIHRATISSVVLAATFTRPWGPLIPLAVGALLGHLFWPQRAP